VAHHACHGRLVGAGDDDQEGGQRAPEVVRDEVKPKLVGDEPEGAARVAVLLRLAPCRREERIARPRPG
jgi:hypothetical protein